MRDHLGLSPTELGFVLLSVACGSLVALPLAGTLITHVGSRRAIRVASVVIGASLLAIAAGYSIGVAPVVGGLFVFGFAIAIWDVAMNVQAAVVERLLGRSIMPRFHAGFSIGAVVGALIGAAMVALHVPVAAHLSTIGIATAVVVPYVAGPFVPDRDPAHAEAEAAAGRPSSQRSALARWREPRTLVIGLLVLAFAFAEGAGSDWIGIGVIDGYHASAALGTLGYAIFQAAMTAARWYAPALLDRYGRVAVVRSVALVGIAGSLLFVYGPNPTVAFVGAALWGVGASLGFPVGMSAAADDPAAAAGRVSVVSSIGYVAFVAGPPTVGFIAGHSTVLHALVAVGVLLTTVVFTAGALRPELIAPGVQPVPSAERTPC